MIVFYFTLKFVRFQDEENNELILDINTYDNPTCFELGYLEQLRNGSGLYNEPFQASVRRYVIPLISHLSHDIPQGTNLVVNGCAKRNGKTITIYSDEIVGKGLEMIGFHPAFQGKNYTYGYGASINAEGPFEKSIAKINFKTKETLLWRAGEHILVGEAIFVPSKVTNEYSIAYENNNNCTKKTNHGSTLESEDEGYLIVPSMDTREDYPDHIYFLNAKTMKEVGRVKFNMRVPPALHGHYLPSSSK